VLSRQLLSQELSRSAKFDGNPSAQEASGTAYASVRGRDDRNTSVLETRSSQWHAKRGKAQNLL